MPGEIAPLSPKSGDTLRVIALGRISTIHQDVENITASYRYIENYLGRVYRGPLDITFLGEQASGMRTDRATIRQAEDMIAAGGVDLVIAEDLSRIYRNPRHQYNFVQDAVDVGTRVILIGDNLDTADENWEVTMGAAALRHGLHIPDTRRRVRRTATHAFHQGGMVQKIRFGYRKLSREEAALGAFGPKGLRIARIPVATPIIVDVSRRVIAGESYAVLADELNERGIVPGPYVTSGRWTSRVLAELLGDPILAGLRTFRDTICEPVFRTGRHRTLKSNTPETARYPELAHLSEAEFASLQEAIETRKRRRQTPKESSARRGVARSRTFWPGQALRCGICGQLFHLAGRTLRCSQSSTRSGRRCWNRVQIKTTLVRRRLIEWLLPMVESAPDCRRYLIDRLYEFKRLLTSKTDAAEAAAVRKHEALRRQSEHLASAIAQGGKLDALVRRLQEVDAELKSLGKRASRTSRRQGATHGGHAADDLQSMIEPLWEQSYPFADWLRRLIPDFIVYPAQALDTPQIRAVGILDVRLDRFTATETPDIGDSPRTFQIELPLYEESQPVKLLPACTALRREHPDWSLRRIAEQLKSNVMNVKRALDYARLMSAAGTDKPFQVLRQAPIAASRWRLRSPGAAKRPSTISSLHRPADN